MQGVGWNLGWSAAIRVDGKPYNLLGDAPELVISDSIQQSFYFSPTRSSYLLQAGAVNVNVTFMTSIEVRNTSLPVCIADFPYANYPADRHRAPIDALHISIFRCSIERREESQCANLLRHVRRHVSVSVLVANLSPDDFFPPQNGSVVTMGYPRTGQ